MTSTWSKGQHLWTPLPGESVFSTLMVLLHWRLFLHPASDGCVQLNNSTPARPGFDVKCTWVSTCQTPPLAHLRSLEQCMLTSSVPILTWNLSLSLPLCLQSIDLCLILLRWKVTQHTRVDAVVQTVVMTYRKSLLSRGKLHSIYTTWTLSLYWTARKSLHPPLLAVRLFSLSASLPFSPSLPVSSWSISLLPLSPRPFSLPHCSLIDFHTSPLPLFPRPLLPSHRTSLEWTVGLFRRRFSHADHCRFQDGGGWENVNSWSGNSTAVA